MRKRWDFGRVYWRPTEDEGAPGRICGDQAEPCTPAMVTSGTPGTEAGVAFAGGGGGADVVTVDGNTIGPTDVVGPMAGEGIATAEVRGCAVREDEFPPGNANPAMGID